MSGKKSFYKACTISLIATLSLAFSGCQVQVPNDINQTIEDNKDTPPIDQTPITKAPIIVPNQSFSIDINSNDGAFIGNIKYKGDKLTSSKIVSGNDDNAFRLVPVAPNFQKLRYNKPNSAKAKTYNLKIIFTNQYGDSKAEIVKVTITGNSNKNPNPNPSKDTTPPVITLKGSSSITITKGNSFNDPGATAVDDRDGKVNVTKSGSVNTNKVGTYIITYKAVDKAGNVATKKRVVKVQEKSTPPSGHVIYVDGVGGDGLKSGGSDSNPGTFNKPLKTITKANSLVKPGTTVVVRGGVYKEQIKPKVSGTKDKPITYLGYNGEYPNVQGVNGNPVNVGGKSYIIIDGFDLYSDKKVDKIVVQFRGSHNSLKNSKIINKKVKPLQPESAATSERTGFGVSVSGSKYNTLENNIISGWWQGLVAGGGTENLTVKNNIIAGNVHTQIAIGTYSGKVNKSDSRLLRHLYEGNIIGGSLTSDGIQTEGGAKGTSAKDAINIRGIVIRNNYFYFNGENALDFKSGGDIVVENNIIAGNIGDNDGTGVRQGDLGPDFEYGATSITQGSQRASERIIIRKNVIYDNGSGPGVKNRDWKIYNNTIVANNRDARGPNSNLVGTGVKGSWGSSVVMNNIIVDNKKGAIGMESGHNKIVDYNLYANSFGPLIFTKGKGKTLVVMNFTEWKNYLKSFPNMKGRDENSIVGDPKFVDVPRYGSSGYPVFDFHQADYMDPVYSPVITFDELSTWFPYDFRLRANSPAIDKGGFLTKSTNSGSNSKILKVQDSKMFFDGYGIVDGDTIKIGSATPVKIVSINHATNTITLASPRSWSKGANVSLPYRGSRPDIGAYEYGD